MLTDLVTASCVIVMSFLLTLSFYAVLVNLARQWFKSAAAIRRLHMATGVLMIGAGVAIITF